MTLRIRDAAEADLEAVARVHVQAWRESYGAFLSAEALRGLSVEERVALWRKALAEADHRSAFLVAEADGEIVGLARGGPVRAEGAERLRTDAELYAVYLLDRVKRRGIGRRLMLGIFHHLAAQGFRSCGLWVLTPNTAARRFYESLGGVAGIEQTFELRGDTVSETAYRFEPIPCGLPPSP